MRSCTRRVLTPQSFFVSFSCVLLFFLLAQSGCVARRFQPRAAVSGMPVNPQNHSRQESEPARDAAKKRPAPQRSHST